MPRFFFDVRDDLGLHRDEIGDTFDSGDDAESLVTQILADMVRDEAPASGGRNICCEVRNEAGRAVYRGELTFTSMRLAPAR